MTTTFPTKGFRSKRQILFKLLKVVKNPDLRVLLAMLVRDILYGMLNLASILS